MLLYERVRAGVEAAPWVCDEIKELEAENANNKINLLKARDALLVRIVKIKELEAKIATLSAAKAIRALDKEDSPEYAARSNEAYKEI